MEQHCFCGLLRPACKCLDLEEYEVPVLGEDEYDMVDSPDEDEYREDQRTRYPEDIDIEIE